MSFPCECEIHQKINHYRKQGIEIHVKITNKWCWADPNPNNSQDPAFLKRERKFTEPIRFPLNSKLRTSEDYIRKVAIYGIHGRYAKLMAERAFARFSQK